MTTKPVATEGVVGSARPERLFAAAVDHAFAILAMFAGAAMVAELGRPSLAGGLAPMIGFSVFLICLLYFFLPF